MTDHGRAFARDPDFRLPALVVRIAAMPPVPSQAERVGGIGPMRSSVKGIYAATIVRLEAINFRHAVSPERLDGAELAAAAAVV